ncbi:LysR family transcriptional regulator [Pseudoduganella umbonata]|uniref:DNA-binding transcriptional LysR family regulator n=1 Tax=Pseudoduganella umbonata TaxID=864828 RepID=A0A4P8HPL7_9BURK|nr:LysR family transcriptional regulator [Pseudoduganella umbonata]MBB3221214.1 DNA-binding transcriptional LysR family regulator [Pseudoduganella umbonata]QCP10400.1 LysR family transcriptional regulator [Pseudoduganella umbonata]
MSSLELIRLFLAVAEHRSFTLAARRLNVSPTAVSKGVRALEARHGVTLFARNTRSVSLTDAGAALLALLKPAVSQIDDAFSALAQFQQRPSGHLRVTAPRAFGFLLARHLVPRMRAKYPDITFDLSLDDGLVDLVAAGYDAGVRLGQAIAQDMVAIRLSRPLSWSIVASPEYFRQRGEPATPHDLLGHATIRYRFATSGVLPPWRLAGSEGEIQLDTDAALCANDTGMIAELARKGLGIAWLPDIEIADDVLHGRLVRTLVGQVPETSGLYLYFPMRSQNQPKMRALIEQAALLAAEGLLDVTLPA